MEEKNNNFGVFRGILEHSSDLFCVTQQDYKLVDTNISFCQFFNITETKLNLFDLLSFHYSNESNFSTKSLNQTNNRYNIINWTRINQEDKECIFWLGKLDLTKKIESLEETGRMGKIGFWEYDIEKDSIFWSEEVYKIHEEPLEKTIALEAGINYYHPDDISIISDAFSKALNEGISYEVELRIITKNNKVKWVKAIGEQVSEGGKAIKVKGTFQDIHRTKIAELKLERSTVLSQQIFDSLPVGIFWKDKEGTYQGFNKTSTEFIGISPSKLIGKKDEDLIKDEQLLKRVLNQDKEIIEEQKIHSENRNVTLSRTHSRTIELKKLPLYNEKNEVFGVLGVYIDNTRLTKLIRSLKSKNSELNELLFAASHDLKEPLQGINRYSQLLKRRYNITLETHGNQMLDYILREAKRQYQQFNGLTRFLEIGNEQRDIKLLNLYNVINDAVNNINFEAFDYPEFELIFNDLPEVNYNEYDLEVVFYELISNAIKFRKINQKLSIEILVIDQKEFWQILFKDNGEGFDVKVKNKVFMIFQKLHNKYYYDGPGIGLSICKKIIEHYGGKIDVESTVSVGTTFSFTIPKVIVQREKLDDFENV